MCRFVSVVFRRPSAELCHGGDHPNLVLSSDFLLFFPVMTLPLLDRTPVIWALLVVQVPDASDVRRVTVCFRPIDCGFLSTKSAKQVVALRLDHVIIDAGAFGAAFRPGFNIDGCHNFIS
jgi:hypothetical protein